MRLGQDKTEVIRQKLLKAFPSEISNDVEIVSSFLQDKNFDIHHSSEYEKEIQINGEKLILPGRTYFEDLDEKDLNTLSKKQITILYCLYLRNNNGFVRQKYLERLSEQKDYFVTPFIFNLLGEYVIEILIVLENIISKNIENYLKFKKENQVFFYQTESRMVSYWNKYYRHPNYPKIKRYVGREIFDRINKFERQSLKDNE
jgi:hypothetical protein